MFYTVCLKLHQHEQTIYFSSVRQIPTKPQKNVGCDFRFASNLQLNSFLPNVQTMLSYQNFWDDPKSWLHVT